MEVDAPQVDDLPDSAVVDSEEPISAPLGDEALQDQDQSTDAPAATEPAQEKPKGDAPAEKADEKGEGDEPKPDEDKPKSGKDAPRGRKRDPQKRIDRLTRQARDAEREAAYLRGKLEALESSRPAEDPNPKPTLEDYDSAEDYADALADWKVAQKSPDRSQPEQPDSPAEPARQGPTEAEVQSYAAAKLKYDDLDDVLFDTSIPWTSHMAEAVSDEPNAAEILYHLGQDEAEVARISKLPPKAQEREVWRFADRLSQTLGTAAPESPEPSGEDEPGSGEGTDDGTPQATAQPRAAVSRAQPVPSTPVGRASSEKPVEKMSEAEYCAYMDRKEREARKLGG